MFTFSRGKESSKDPDDAETKSIVKPIDISIEKSAETEHEPIEEAMSNNGDKADGAGLRHCLHCQSSRIHRIKREGFMEEMIFPLISKYPFRCSDCGEKFLSRGRG